MNNRALKAGLNSCLQNEARATVAKPLVHPSRLLLLDLLAEQELCVRALTEHVGGDPSTVSKHLSVQKDARLVQSRREGTSQFYYPTCGCRDGFFDCLEKVVPFDARQRPAARAEGCPQ